MNITSIFGGRSEKNKPCGAVIVAAGSATRMRGTDKVCAPLCGKPVIAHALQAFQDCNSIDEIVIVTRPELMEYMLKYCDMFSKVKTVVTGGEAREDSVRNGLKALSPQMAMVAVHDAARPLVTPELIDRTVWAAGEHGAAVPAIEVKDTIKVEQSGMVLATPNRSTLRAVQTPQTFDVDLLRGALAKAVKDRLIITDDSSAVEYLGVDVKIVHGDERNLKITTPLDLKIAELLMGESK